MAASVAAGIEPGVQTVTGGKPMHSIVTAPALAVWRVGAPKQSLPDPVPKPPGRPPGELIIIKDPPRPPEVPEIDGSLDEEDDPEIKKPPEITPEMHGLLHPGNGRIALPTGLRLLRDRSG
jgi:hypothetical protein